MEREIVRRDSELHGAGLAGLQCDFLESAQSFDVGDERCVEVARVELYDLLSVPESRVCNVGRDDDLIALVRQFRPGVCERSVAQAVPEDEFGVVVTLVFVGCVGVALFVGVLVVIDGQRVGERRGGLG